MSAICFITTCMGRLSFLQQSLARLVEQPDCSCVVVDYSCPEQCGDWVSATYSQVKVIRVPSQKRFNLSRARNAALPVSDAPWVCFIDADILIDPSLAKVLRPLLQPGYYYRPDSFADRGIAGTCIVHQDDLLRTQGYDACIEGWGEEDTDFYAMLQFFGVQAGTFPAALLQHLPHDDDLKTQYYDTKNHRRSWTINHVYRTIKIDLMRLSGALLPEPQRLSLYQRIEQLVSSQRADLSLTIEGSRSLGHGIQLVRELKYKLTIPSASDR